MKTESPHNELLTAALAYAARGWRVFPCFGIVNGACTCGRADCSSPGKHPLTRDGFKSATVDECTILGWWAEHPLAHVAIATGADSGVFVVDLDRKRGKDGLRSLVALGIDLRPYLETAARTGGGGVHFYFAHPGGVVPCSSGSLGPGIDIRGDGGYVIAPPSGHISGGVYAW